MTKRKLQDKLVSLVVPNNTAETGLLNSQYYNQLNLDSIKIYNERVIFHSTVTSTTIAKLFEFIKIIIESSVFDRVNNQKNHLEFYNRFIWINRVYTPT